MKQALSIASYFESFDAIVELLNYNHELATESLIELDIIHIKKIINKSEIIWAIVEADNNNIRGTLKSKDDLRNWELVKNDNAVNYLLGVSTIQFDKYHL